MSSHCRKTYLPLAALACLLALGLVSCATADRTRDYAPVGVAHFISPIQDDWEPLNRATHAFNAGLETHVMSPAAQLVRFCVPAPVRAGISNATENLGFPVRVASHLLQAEWAAAGKDTGRFLVNTTVGILGLFDPATNWGLPHIHGSFTQTLARWGVPRGQYLNLPVLGPGSVRDAAGKILDMPLNPVGWFLPWSVSFPINTGLRINDHVEDDPTLARFFATQYDHYELAKLMTVLAAEAAETTPVPRDDYDCDQSFGYLAFTPDQPAFHYEARQRRARLPDGHRLPYACWPKRGAKRIVLLLPGIGGHRQSEAVSALAQIFLRQGCAVIALSSTFTPDYFLNSGSDAPPGYFPADVPRLAANLAAVLADYRRHYRTGGQEECYLLGYSLGAINALHLAAAEDNGEIAPGLRIQRYLAINPPRDVMHALRTIDQYYDIPLRWPEEKREERIRQMAARLLAVLNTQPPPAPMPLTRDESQFLIGLSMRLNLAAVLQAQEQRRPTGALREAPDAVFHRNNLFAETLAFPFQRYLEKLVLPYYRAHGLADLPDAEFARRCSLDALQDALAKNDRVFVFQNRNDFLIRAEDAEWYTAVFGARAILFDNGGHLGSMPVPAYQQAMAATLLGNRSPKEIHQ